MPATPGCARAALGLFVVLSGMSSALGAQTHAPATAHRHMSLTPTRPGTADDTARALAFVHQVRSSIAPYQTLEAAEAAGYHARRDGASVQPGRLLHVGRMRRAGEWSTFEPAAPQALLYRRDPDGTMRLAGAMFVAPLGATPADLDAMIPLSVAHWHRHLNVCRSADRDSVRRFPRVTTAEACTRVGGRFRAESRYMIHVMTDAGDDPAAVFPQGREVAAMEMGAAGEHR